MDLFKNITLGSALEFIFIKLIRLTSMISEFLYVKVCLFSWTVIILCIKVLNE